MNYTLLVGLTICLSCVPVEPPPPTPPLQLDFDRQSIDDLWSEVDKRDRTSLLRMMRSRDPNSRLIGTRAYHTMQDSTVLDSIALLLKDPEMIIRQSAAFALGQSKHPKAAVILTQAFQELDSMSINSELSGTILEAIGKTGDRQLHEYLTSVKSYTARDTQLVYGQMMALYRFVLRGIESKSGADHAYKTLQNMKLPPKVRLMAAHYLGRSASIDISGYEEGMRRLGFEEKDPHIRMAIATGFKHSRSDFGYLSLKDWYANETDYRVRVNIIRSLVHFKNKGLSAFLLKASRDPNVHVATVASEALVNSTIRSDAKKIRLEARTASRTPWQVRANLYRAANKNMPNKYRIAKTNMNQEIWKRYVRNKDPYIKAAYLKAWAVYGANLDKLIELYAREKDAIIRTAILETAIKNGSKESVRQVYWGYENTARRKITQLMQQAVEEGDPTAIALVSEALSADFAYWKPYFRSLDFIEQSLTKLNLPKDFEAHLAAKKLLSQAKGVPLPVSELRPQYNHPIDWSLVSELRDTVEGIISTTKGDLIIELYRSVAPGVVANFVQLADAGYYDTKAFHRVVPNFVIQNGCPIGNGFGSLDYSIRSEFSALQYDDEGWIGMASVGADTEGTQWFITHSPTPHLDGRYTIFGKVIKGKQIIHKIEQGDRVKNIKINKN